MSVVCLSAKKEMYCCHADALKGAGLPNAASTRDMLASCSMGKLCWFKSDRSKEPPSGLGEDKRARPPMEVVKSGPMLRPSARPLIRCGIVMDRPSWWIKPWFARANLKKRHVRRE